MGLLEHVHHVEYLSKKRNGIFFADLFLQLLVLEQLFTLLCFDSPHRF